MLESQNLSQTLSNKIDALLARMEIIKSENEMLREELSRTKETLQQTTLELESRQKSVGLEESEVTALIEKLERALS